MSIKPRDIIGAVIEDNGEYINMTIDETYEDDGTWVGIDE